MLAVARGVECSDRCLPGALFNPHGPEPIDGINNTAGNLGESSTRGATRVGTITIRHAHLDNRLLEPVEIIGTTTARVRKRERVGGLLNYYYREAA